mmetsp:Transcript_21729/g.16038  ORF Transcript_21729/g.16038 Transcript_21729/m.16038 type:complete len:195 (+) Transcript_21729:1010-1594(+)
MTEFFADGGTTKFVDRLTGALGIHAADVKVVAVYSGSVWVEFNYQPSDNRSINKYKRTLTKLIKNDNINLGAPILEASFGDIGDEEYIVQSDADAQDADGATKGTHTTTASSSSVAQESTGNQTTVVVGNSTIVITKDGANQTATEDDAQGGRGSLVGENINGKRIAIIVVVLTVVLVALIVAAVVLYRRNKHL